MKAGLRKTLIHAVTPVVVVYVGTVGLIFAPYYNWQYASEHGFVSWVIFGEIIPSAKALVWPYFVFGHSSKAGVVLGWTDAEKANSKHMLLSWQADLAAIRLSNGRQSPVLSAEEETERLSLKRTALEEARLVSDEVLAKAHSQLPSHFRGEYERGLELAIQALEEKDEKANAEGMILQEKWVDWFNTNKRSIVIPK
jgi:hypothetical protein